VSPTDNPFAAVEEMARRQEAEPRAARAVRAAHTRMMHDAGERSYAASVFFSELSSRLKQVVDWDCKTMWTDGLSLGFNPDFVNGLPLPQLMGVLAHETVHVANGHHIRMGDRDLATWNEAADCAVNEIVLESGFQLPPDCYLPGKGKHKDLPRGKSAEEYYRLLCDAKSPQPEQEGDEDDNPPAGNQDPGGCGGVKKPGEGSPAELAEQAGELQVAMAQITQQVRAAGRGDLPGGLARLVTGILNPPLDWREVLRDFLTTKSKSGRSWQRPNRRLVHRGIYMPGKFSRKLGRVLIAVDTSGSVGPRELAAFGNEVEAILGAHECTATVLYHDSVVQKTQDWEPSDGPLKLEPVGGGGTSHVPVFEHAEAQDEPYTCVIALTDCWTTYPAQPPDVPTLWAVIGNDNANPPFGRVVHIKE
jgi:predicted metal-dependent peptidase